MPNSGLGPEPLVTGLRRAATQAGGLFVPATSTTICVPLPVPERSSKRPPTSSARSFMPSRPSLPARARCETLFRRRKPAAVVGHRSVNAVVAEIQLDRCRSRARMLLDVSERLLGDPEEREFDRAVNAARLSRVPGAAPRAEAAGLSPPSPFRWQPRRPRSSRTDGRRSWL